MSRNGVRPRAISGGAASPSEAPSLISHLNVLRTVAEAVSRSLDLNEVMQKSLAALTHVTGHEIASLHLIASDGHNLVLCGERGLSEQLREVNLTLPIGEGLIGRVAASGRVRLLDEVSRAPDLLPAAREAVVAAGIRGFVCVPIRARHRILGTLSLGRQTDQRFTGEEVALLECTADQIGLALDNARLYSETRRQLDELRQSQTDVVRAERLAAVGELAGGVAHEINNPLMIILGQVHLLLQGEQFKAVLELHEARLAAQRIKVNAEIEDVEDVWADPSQLQEVLQHLIQNAEQAMVASHGGGTLSIRVRPAAGGARIEVADDGPGIPPQDLPRIFNPFFTTKEPGQGRGLGLSVVHSVIAEHGGRLWVENRPEGGAVFVLELPVRSSSETPAHAGQR